VRANIGFLAVGFIMVLFAHRSPAPISEIPESPTPAPQQSAKPQPKRTAVPKEVADESKPAAKAPSQRTPGPKEVRATGQLVELEPDKVVFTKGSERWEAACDSRTEISGAPKVGDLATIIYRMVASDSDVASYHLSGSILEITDSIIALQKGKYRWEIACNREQVRGRVGEKTTVAYKLIATSIVTVSPKQ